MPELSEEVKGKVLKQVDFYFCDSNLPKDKFLLQQVKDHPEGYVDLSLIISFTRMLQHLNLKQGTKAEDVPDDVIAQVAAVLRGSELLEVSESGYQVRRKTALPDEQKLKKVIDERSLYARPFPLTTTIEAVHATFTDAGAKVNCVRLRRHKVSRDFKGSAFIELADKDEMERVKEMAIEFEGAPLRMMPKREYLGMKLQARKERPNAQKGELNIAILEEMDSEFEAPIVAEINNSTEELRQKRAALDAGEPAAKKARGNGEADADAGGEEGGDAAAAAAEDVEMEAAAAEQFKPGCLVRLEFAEKPEGAFPKMIKDGLGGWEAHVSFVEFPRGADVATARFATPEAAQAALKAWQDKEEDDRVMCGVAAVLKPVEGEEEAAFYERAAKEKAEREAGGGRGGGRGGRGRGGGRGGRGRVGGGRGRGGRGRG